ncbi:MAG: hypothetical protein KC431_30245 [Myxococcales bacterium]|nr:hypothetical protein [Myxococcales bacterium]MCA9701841.1 hypothetical protein [Myxococcales bacterium]
MSEVEATPLDGADQADLTKTLLRGESAFVERRPESRWAYPVWAMVVLSVFLAYHSFVMLVANLPGNGLAKTFHKDFLDGVHGHDYFRTAQLHQSWGMFAPNPNRTNAFIRVFVEDAQGDLWDFEQDIWEEDRYPYWFYDRRGKINRRLDGKKHYQSIYGAWVCREWERQHGGEPAKSVTFVKRWTKVPAPQEVLAKGGWDQWGAYKQTEQETITCKTTLNAQLPPYLRERYGLPPLEDEEAFRSVRQQTWWDKAEAERKKQEREAETAARREQLQADRDARKAERETRREQAEREAEPAPADDDENREGPVDDLDE